MNVDFRGIWPFVSRAARRSLFMSDSTTFFCVVRSGEGLWRVRHGASASTAKKDLGDFIGSQKAEAVVRVNSVNVKWEVAQKGFYSFRRHPGTTLESVS